MGGLGAEGWIFDPLAAAKFCCVCVCLFTVLSTTCYVLEVHSRYRSLSTDYDLIASTARQLAASQRRSGYWADPLTFGGVFMHRGFDARRLNTTTARPRTLAAAPLYGLQQIDCSWFPPISPTLPLPAAVENASLLLFFIHGNAGSASQAKYWSCAAQYVSKALGVQAETFSFEFSEQANVHRGHLVSTQAEYIGDVVETMVHERQSAASAGVRLHVWLVAHSMGGIVARMAAQLLSPTVALAGIITFNAPLLFPPLLLDAPMADVYCALSVAEQQPPVELCGSPYDVSSTRLTSSELLRSCTLGNCSVRRSCRRDKTILISITSGEMDLMIEPSTTHMSAWRSAYIVTSLNTLHPEVCGHSSSHNKVLHDPCTTVSAAFLLVASSLNMLDNMEDVTGLVLNTTGARNGDIAPEIPLSPAVSVVGYVGRELRKRQVWPCAAAALYGHILLSGLHTYMGSMAQAAQLQKKGLWRIVRPVSHALATPSFHPVLTVGFFYTCALSYTTVAATFFWLFGGWESHSARAPWSWACYPQLHASSAGAVAPAYLVFGTAVFVLVSIGPVVLGALAGVVVVRAIQATHRFARVLTYMYPRSVHWQTNRLRCAFVPLLVLVLVGVLQALGATLTTRALVWLALLVLMPSPHHLPAGKRAWDEDIDAILISVAPSSEAVISDVTHKGDEVGSNRCLAGQLYGVVYVLQLSPFFTIRNTLFSHTVEDASTVDWRNYAAECGVLGLLCATAVSRRFDCGGMPFLGALRVACVLLALTGVGMVTSHPIESFRVLPALLCCLPVYLYKAISV